MGCRFSKSAETSNSTSHSQTQMDSNSEPIRPDLTSYEDACRLDPKLLSFDAVLQQRTGRVITTLAAGGLDRNLSMDSLREVTGCLLDMNQDVVSVILEYKKDIWKDTDMFDLVEEYFDCSLSTLDFCTALERCLKRARDSQLMIHFALQLFELEHREAGNCGEGKNYERTLQELRNFKAADDPFPGEFFTLLQSLRMKQTSMFNRLEQKRKKFDKKLKSAKAWRRVSNVIFAATFVGVLVFSVVAVAISAPPVVTALAAAASVPVGTMGKWFNSLWTKYQNELKGQRMMLRSMEMGTFFAITELDGIRVRVDKLQIKIEALLQNADFAVREEDEAVMLAMEEVKKEMDGFMQAIEDLTEHASKISRLVRKARSVIVERIIRRPTR